MRKVSARELANMVSNGSTILRDETLKESLADMVEKLAANPPKVIVDMNPVTSGMAAMRASIVAMHERQVAVQERLTEELARMNARDTAVVKVTKRTEEGGIDAAEIKIL